MRVLGILLALFVAGCATDTTGLTIPTSARAPTFATQLAGPQTYLAPMPTAVVLLKPDDLNRNRAFCAAVTRLPTAQQALAGSVVAPNLVLTRWLVQLPDVPAARAADCDFLVGTYDYARAARLTQALRLQEGSLSGPGPFLLMVIPDATGLHVAGLNGSALTEADFPGFVGTWSTALHQAEGQITRAPDEPGVVRSVFNLVSAVLRGVAGIGVGIIRGLVGAL